MLFLKLGTHVATLNKFTILAGVVAGVLFGGWQELFTYLLIMQGLDIITGVLVGGKFKSISSSVMNTGIKKKLATWIALILAHVIDIVLFDGQAIAQTGILFALLGNEGLSLVENLGKLGVPMPESITKYLIQIRSQGDSKAVSVGNVPASTVEQVIVLSEEGMPQIMTPEITTEEKA